MKSFTTASIALFAFVASAIAYPYHTNSTNNQFLTQIPRKFNTSTSLNATLPYYNGVNRHPIWNTSNKSKSDSEDSSFEKRTNYYTGEGTYYYQYGVAGACGNYNSDWAQIVALPPDLFGNGENCGRTIVVWDTTNPSNSQGGVVADKCPGCSGGHVDMSLGLFQFFGPIDLNPINEVAWFFKD